MLFGAATLPADFSYQEKSTITGGAIASMMKVAGVFSSKAREPIASTVAVKGDRMVHRSQSTVSIIDLSNQTITNVDLQKKTYSVMTFDEMRQALQALSQKGKKEGAPEATFKVSASNTGNTKQIGGFNTREVVVKMEMEVNDPDNKGQKGAMAITTDMWIAPGMAGYNELRDFQKRMAEKLNWAPGGNMFMSNPEVVKGMAEVAKEIGKLDGVPVFQTITMGGAGMPSGAAQASAAQQPARQQSGGTAQAEAQQAEANIGSAAAGTAGDAAGGAVGNKAGGRLGGAIGNSVGGALGRFGGFGRKKQEPKQEPPAQQASAPPAAAGSAPGTLLEMQTEMSGFSNAAVDSAQFDVPAGFKKVESDLKRVH
jgi:hypothetical protein